VVVSQIDGVITVPSSAVSRRGIASTVTVVRGGKKSVQPIVTGITGDSTIQIISGLSAGQQVAIAIPTGSSRGAGAGAGGTGGGFRIGGGLGGGGGFGGGGGGFRRAAGPGGAG
jgi:multidrug efflux pump subunit AcrA (membrane-fusion protein)